MAHTKQAKKRIASSLNRKSCNRRYITIAKHAMKCLSQLPSVETFIAVQKSLDRAKSRGAMHANRANRLKSSAARRLLLAEGQS